LKSLKFKDPGPEGEKLFLKGFDAAVKYYSEALVDLRERKRVIFENIDFDTGKVTTPGEYGLADKTYSDMLVKLDNNNFVFLTHPLKENILRFYRQPALIKNVKVPRSDRINWDKTNAALHELKLAKPVSIDSLKT
jgi:hypothetical protein